MAGNRLPVTAAYLFGSYSEGTPDEDSDIDIAIFSPAADEMLLEEKIGLLAELRLEVGAEVELHLYGDSCFREARPSNIYGHILATGRKIA